VFICVIFATKKPAVASRLYGINDFEGKLI